MAAGDERKTGAILAAEVVGYSGLAGSDQASTIARSKDVRREFVQPLIARCRGRLAQVMGDGVLVEFASAVAAVECALALQKGMAEREAGVPEAQRLQYRVGVNLGGIDVHGDDIAGAEASDAVRLAAIAEPGGICLARPLYDEVKSELKLPYEHHGDWMRIALMSTTTPDAWPHTMNLIEVSAVKINAAAITSQSTNARLPGLLRSFKRLLDRRSD